MVRDQAVNSSHRAAFLSLLAIIPVIATLVVALANDSLRAALDGSLVLVARYTVAMVLAPLLAWIIARSLGSRLNAASFSLFASVLAFAVFAGFGQTSAMVLLLAASLVLGTVLLRDEPAPTPGLIVASMLAGLGLIVAVVSWLLPFRVHTPTAYVLILGLIVLAGWSRLNAALRIVATGWKQSTDEQPLAAFFAMAVIGLAAVLTWLPSLNPDDNSAHLLLARQLLADSYYRIDVSTQIFAAAPWFNNTLHGVLSVLSGAEARSATGLIWLVFGATGAYRLAHALGARGSFTWLAAALYASHPLASYFGMTLQVDGASAACLLQIAASCVDLHRADERSVSPVLIGSLCGIFAALKIINCVYLVMLGGWLIWHFAMRGQLRRMLLLLATAALVAGSSYFYAWLITGNPVFPLYNAVFQSAYMPSVNFGDARWQTGVSPGVLWDLTFSTGNFMESYSGAAGLSLLALLGAWAVSLLSGGWRAALIVIALAGASIIFFQVQYLRYVFPAIALLATVAVVSIGASRYRRIGAAALVALIVAQCGLIRTTSWILGSGQAEKMLAHGPRSLAEIEGLIVPERALVRQLEASGEQFCLLFADPVTAYIALAPGRSLTTAFYDPKLSALATWANEDPTAVRWLEALDRIGVTHVEFRPAQANAGLLKALSEADFAPISKAGEAQIWARPGQDASKCLTGMLARRDEARRLLSRQ